MNLEPILEILFNPPKVELSTSIGDLVPEINKRWIVADKLRSIAVNNWKNDDCDTLKQLGEYNGQIVYLEHHQSIIKNTSISSLTTLVAALTRDKVLLEKIACRLDGSASGFVFDLNRIFLRTDFTREENTSKFYKRHTCEASIQEKGSNVMKGVIFTVNDGLPIDIYEIGGMFLHEQSDNNLRFESISIFASKIPISTRCQTINKLLSQRWNMLNDLLHSGQLPRIEDVGISAFNSVLKEHPCTTALKFSNKVKNLRMDEYAITAILLREYAATCSESDIIELLNPFVETPLHLTSDVASIRVKFRSTRDPVKKFIDLKSPEFSDFESLLAPKSFSNSSFYYPSPLVQPSFDMSFVPNPFSTSGFDGFPEFNQHYDYGDDEALIKMLLAPDSPSDGAMVVSDPHMSWTSQSQYNSELLETFELAPQEDYYMREESSKRKCCSNQQQMIPHAYTKDNTFTEQINLLKAAIESGSASILPDLRQKTFEAFNSVVHLAQKQDPNTSLNISNVDRNMNSPSEQIMADSSFQQQNLANLSHSPQHPINYHNNFAYSDAKPTLVSSPGSLSTQPNTPSVAATQLFPTPFRLTQTNTQKSNKMKKKRKRYPKKRDPTAKAKPLPAGPNMLSSIKHTIQ
eukprot:TRINITY_DN22583_c0_g1_i1.p1 TRINITY_DN22583_c0_g1~~TRINITY_DN22583_c0_g1_i1.p1  ORF type:complete len:632 (-),score=114.20 TRINITY_DN22583_c0_g1_i1:161-2056(-)